MVYPSVQRTKIIKDAGDIKYLKALAAGASTERLAGIFYRNLKFRPLLHSHVCQNLSQECTALCSDKEPSVLKKTGADELETIDWDVLITEWKQRTPLLYEVLHAVACNIHQKGRSQGSPEKHHPSIGQAGCALLFHRNPKMCRLQMATGLVLDRGGTTDEVWQ